MIPPATSKTASIQDDSEEVARALEIELCHKRAAWQRAAARYRAARTISFIFLFIVIVFTAAAFFFLFSRVKTAAANAPGSAATSEQRH